MKVLFANNLHRGRGGADAACEATIRAARAGGLDVRVFSKDSRDLSTGIVGKVQAFTRGIYARKAVAEFRDELAAFQPDVVHSFELYPLISPWILRACRRARVPAVMTCCDYRISCPVATRFRAGKICHDCAGGREHWALLHNCRGSLPESFSFAVRNTVARRAGLFTQYVDHFVAPSDFLKQWLIDDVGIQAEKITVIHCVIEIPPAPVEDPSRGEYVAFAGRFVPEKGVENLIAAARQAGLPLKLAGHAASHPAVRPGDHVEFVMTRRPEDLAAFYRNARMLAMPSVFLETFGIVAAEAMSHGIPVVASRIGALSTTVRHEQTGLLVEPGNVSELAAALRRVWDDPDLCRKMGRAGREVAQTQFCHDACFPRYQRVYDRATGVVPRLDEGDPDHSPALPEFSNPQV